MSVRDQRKINYTPSEKKLLTELAKQHPELIVQPRDASGRKRKQDAWEQITMIFNGNSNSSVYRSTPELKTCLQNILQRTKKRGPYRPKTFMNVSRMRRINFTPFERKLLLSLARNHEVLHSSNKDSVTQMEKRKAWSSILMSFNKNPNTDTQRSVPELKTCLQNLLRRSQEKEVEEIRQIREKDVILVSHTTPADAAVVKMEEGVPQSYQPVQVETFDPTQEPYEGNEDINDQIQPEPYLIQDKDEPPRETLNSNVRSNGTDGIRIRVHTDSAPPPSSSSSSVEPLHPLAPLVQAATAYMDSPPLMSGIHVNGPTQLGPSRIRPAHTAPSQTSLSTTGPNQTNPTQTRSSRLVPRVMLRKEKLSRMRQRLLQEEHDLRLTMMREEHRWKLEEHEWLRQEHELRMNMIRINSRI